MPYMLIDDRHTRVMFVTPDDIEPTLTSSDVPDLDIVCKCVLGVKGNNCDIYVSKINTHDSGDSLTDNQDTTARQTRNRTVPITVWTAHVCQIVDIYVKQLSLPESRRCSTTDVSWVILRVGRVSLFPRSHDSPRYSNYNDNIDNTQKHTISMTQTITCMILTLVEKHILAYYRILIIDISYNTIIEV